VIPLIVTVYAVLDARAAVGYKKIEEHFVPTVPETPLTLKFALVTDDGEILLEKVAVRMVSGETLVALFAGVVDTTVGDVVTELPEPLPPPPPQPENKVISARKAMSGMLECCNGLNVFMTTSTKLFPSC
jgi:hypothetical protein